MAVDNLFVDDVDMDLATMRRDPASFRKAVSKPSRSVTAQLARNSLGFVATMATASSTLCFWSCRFFKSASKSDSRSKVFLVEKEAKDADVLMEETVKGSFVSRAHIRLSI